MLHWRETLIFTDVACLLPTAEKMQTIALTKKNVFRMQFQAFRKVSLYVSVTAYFERYTASHPL